MALSLGLVFESGRQDLHSFVFVAMLGAIVLALDHQTRRQVSDAHSRICLVDMLPTCTTGPEGVYPQVSGLDHNVSRGICLWHHSHRASRGMNASLCFGLGHTLNTMCARFKLQPTIDAFTLDADNHLFVTTQL